MRALHFVIPLAVALGASAAPFAARAQIALNVTVDTPPPELPVYEQPPLPAPGYIFMPGYWAYGDEGYYWIPATWVEPPEPGLLWTPGYWGWNSGRYLFNAGYWGTTVGYYGGIDYGFGYGGFGYEGGYWRGGVFNYNSAVNRFGGVHVTNVYVKNVTRVTVNRYAFNGPGGVNRQPRPEELAAARERHIPPTAMQQQHVQAARQNHALLASVNHGRPAILATPRAGAFGGANRTPAAGQAPGPHGVARPGAPNRPFGGPARPATPGVASPGVASPHPVARAATPDAPRPAMRENQGSTGGLTPHAQYTPRPMEPHSMPAPRPMESQMAAPRPMGGQMAAPRPMGGQMAAPRPMGGQMPAPRPMGAPGQGAPHPAAAQHDEKPKH